jgi:hypothetical protein
MRERSQPKVRRKRRRRPDDERLLETPQRVKTPQGEFAQLQRQVGNRAAREGLVAGNRVPVSSLQGARIQRAPDEAGAQDPSAAAEQQVGGGGDAWDSIVAARLEKFLADFQNIPVKVAWQDDGEKQETTVHVHPPYFINTRKYKNSKKRIEAAEKHRKQATGSAEKVPVETSWFARHGKSTPQEIQSILERALKAGKIPTPEGKTHPDGEDLRAWLVKYGIGVDCSGFVSQALMSVMAEVRAQAGEQGPTQEIKKGSGALKGGAAGFAKVNSPSELRPGDTMHTPGHIRILMGVENTEEGVVFTTAESTSASGDIGPNRAVWRYPDSAKLNGLQRKKGKLWKKYGAGVTMGRYKALESFTAEKVPQEHLKEERSPEGPLEAEEKGLLEKIEQGAEALITTGLKMITAATEAAKDLLNRVARWLREMRAAPAVDSEGAEQAAAITAMEPGKAALTLAVQKGERDEIKLTDLVFHTRHPELGGEPIGKDDKELAKEWIKIRKELVRPAIQAAE